jgi:hypothetical protein
LLIDGRGEAADGSAAEGQRGLLIDELVATLAAGAARLREPVAAFVAVLDAERVRWACAGHPGGRLVAAGEAVALAGGARLGDGAIARGEAAFGPDGVLVIGSRGDVLVVEVRRRAGSAILPPQGGS